MSTSVGKISRRSLASVISQSRTPTTSTVSVNTPRPSTRIPQVAPGKPATYRPFSTNTVKYPPGEELNPENEDDEKADRAMNEDFVESSFQEAYQDSIDMGVTKEYRESFDQAERMRGMMKESFLDDVPAAKPAPRETLVDLLKSLGHEDPHDLINRLKEHDRRRLEFAQAQLEDTESLLDAEFEGSDAEFDYEIAPGTTIADLVKAGVPAREIVEYSRGMMMEGLVKPSYERVNLKQLGRQATRQREVLEAQGIDGSYRSMFELTEDQKASMSSQDVQDLEDYYSHFDEYREDDADTASLDLNDPHLRDERDSEGKPRRPKLNEAQFPEDTATSKALRSFSRTVPMDEPLPKELQKRVNLMLSDVNYKKARDNSYFLNNLEIWYIANRLPVVYSILKRIFTELRNRIPAYKPKSVLEFAAGASPGLWSVRDVFYQDFAEYTCVERDGRLALMGQQLTADLGIHIHYRAKLLMDPEAGKEAAGFNDYSKNKARSKGKDKKKAKKNKAADAKKNMEAAAREQKMREKKDMVIVPYALSKQPNKEYRRLLLESLWDQVNPNGGVMVLLESTENDESGFNVIREARDYLLKTYPKAMQEDTSIVDVPEDVEHDPAAPAWARGVSRKKRTKDESVPSASSILPCAHDRPCPMLTMQKLHQDFLALRRAARQQGTVATVRRAPVTACKFGQRMLRGPMPSQSPLQDLRIPRPLGDAVIENFSYVVMRRGEPEEITQEHLEYTVGSRNIVLSTEKISAEEELEARQIAMSMFGAKSVDNQERVETLASHVIRKKVKTHNDEPAAAAPEPVETENAFEEINDAVVAVEEQERLEAESYFNEDGQLRMDMVQQLADDMGIELNDDTIEIFKAELDAKYRAKLNPKKEFNKNRWARIVSPPLKRGGHTIMDICTPAGTIERRVVGREGVGSKGYKQARVGKWGDVWPYKKAVTVRDIKEQKNMAELQARLNTDTPEEALERLDEMKKLFSPSLQKEDLEFLQSFDPRLKVDKANMAAEEPEEAAVEAEVEEKAEAEETPLSIDDIIAQVEATLADKQRVLEQTRMLKQTQQELQSKAAEAASTADSLEALFGAAQAQSEALDLEGSDAEAMENMERLHEHQRLHEKIMGKMEQHRGAAPAPAPVGGDDDFKRNMKSQFINAMLVEDRDVVRDYDASDSELDDAFDATKHGLHWEGRAAEAVDDDDDIEMDIEPAGALDAINESSTFASKLKANRARRGAQQTEDYDEYIEEKDGQTVISINVDKPTRKLRTSSPGAGKRSFSTATGSSAMASVAGAGLTLSRTALGSSLAGHRRPSSLLSIRNNMHTLSTRAFSKASLAALIGAPTPVTSLTSATSLLLARSFGTKAEDEAELARSIAFMDPDEDVIPAVRAPPAPPAPKKKGMVKMQLTADPRTVNAHIRPQKWSDPYAAKAPVSRHGLTDSLKNGRERFQPMTLRPSAALQPTSHSTDDILRGGFRFDGVMAPLSQSTQMRAVINSRKLKRMAGINPDTNLPDGADFVPTGDIEQSMQQMVEIEEDVDPSTVKGPWDDGIRRRKEPPTMLPEHTIENLIALRKDDEYERNYSELFMKSQLDAVTRTDEYGNKLKGQLGMGNVDADRTYTQSYQDVQRKLLSREKARKFRQRIEHGKQQAIESRGGVYEPPTLGDHRMHRAVMNELGNTSPQETGMTLEQRLRTDLESLRAERKAVRDKNVSYTGVDLIDPEAKNATPSLRARTNTEKRASMAVIENDGESQLREDLKKDGLDLSLTALLTNKDGFGPKMDPLTGRMLEGDVEAPPELDVFRAEAVEDLEHYADSKTLDKARSIIKAVREVARDAKGRSLRLKLKKVVKDEEDDIELPVLGSEEDGDKRYHFSVSPVSQEDMDQIEATRERSSAVRFKDGTHVDRDVVNTFKNAPAISPRLVSLADRFKELSKANEERELLKASQFQPLEVPDMKSSWSAKNRSPDAPEISRRFNEKYTDENRNYDRVMAEFQEAELLDRLGAFQNVQLPAATGPAYLHPDAPETEREMSVAELREALEFERAMQDAVEGVYTSARKKLRDDMKNKSTDQFIDAEHDVEDAEYDDIPQEDPSMKKSKGKKFAGLGRR